MNSELYNKGINNKIFREDQGRLKGTFKIVIKDKGKITEARKISGKDLLKVGNKRRQRFRISKLSDDRNFGSLKMDESRPKIRLAQSVATVLSRPTTTNTPPKLNQSIKIHRRSLTLSFC